MYSHKICTHTYTQSRSDIKVDSNVYTHTVTRQTYRDVYTHTGHSDTHTHVHLLTLPESPPPGRWPGCNPESSPEMWRPRPSRRHDLLKTTHVLIHVQAGAPRQALQAGRFSEKCQLKGLTQCLIKPPLPPDMEETVCTRYPVRMPWVAVSALCTHANMRAHTHTSIVAHTVTSVNHHITQHPASNLPSTSAPACLPCLLIPTHPSSQTRHALLQEVLSDAPLAELGKSSGLAQCPVPPASQLSPVCLCFLPYLVTGLSPFLNQALQEDRPRTAFFSSISNIQHRTAP